MRSNAMVRSFSFAAVIAAALLAGDNAAPARVFDAKAWLADLDQVQREMASRYANLEWAVFNREAKLPELFASTRERVKSASNDADARAAFDRFARKLGDGHLLFVWPHGKGQNSGPATDPCRSLGYDAASRAGVLAADAPGYRAIETSQSSDFPAGLITPGQTKVGIVKIGVFMPQGFPALCGAAFKALALPVGKICDDTCSSAVDAWVVSRLTHELAEQIRTLQKAGAQVLLIDIADNGGGTEWAETVARMVTPIRLKSERVDFVRGAGWANSFASDEAALRRFAKTANANDRALLHRGPNR